MNTMTSRFQPAQTYMQIKYMDEKVEARAELAWNLTELAMTLLVLGCLAYGLYEQVFHG